MYKVYYQVYPSGEFKQKEFDSEYFCRKFINKCRHTKWVRLISYPTFRW